MPYPLKCHAVCDEEKRFGKQPTPVHGVKILADYQNVIFQRAVTITQCTTEHPDRFLEFPKFRKFFTASIIIGILYTLDGHFDAP
jgi:hypothetical protein